MPWAAKRATSVQPSFALTGSPLRWISASSSGWVREGAAPSAQSTTSIRSPSSITRFQQRPHLRLGLGRRAVRCEAMVDEHRRLVGDDVAGHPALDPDGLERFAVLAAVDDR